MSSLPLRRISRDQPVALEDTAGPRLKVAPQRSEPSAPAIEVRSLDITVLAGGPGVEREVSLASGKAIHEALERLGHRAVLRDIGPDDLSALCHPADFVFVALHGEFGEDGTVQARLENLGLRFSGSGSVASQWAMDKTRTKNLAEAFDIPTPAYTVVDQAALSDLGGRFALPAVVKPVASGSSVDTFLVRTGEALQAAAVDVVARHGSALVERLIEGPELTVGILGDRPLPVCEIQTDREFYDYEAKYVDDATRYLMDPDLPAPCLKRVQEMSLTIHRALGCRVFSRVDWMLDAATGQPFLLEVNTIPGFTSHSLLPKAAARAGIGFDALCEKIVELSIGPRSRS